MNRNNILTFVILFILSPFAFAQTHSIDYLESNFEISDSIIRDMKRDKEFAYVLPQSISAPASWSQKWNAFKQSLRKKLMSLRKSENFNIILIGITFVFLVYFFTNLGMVRRNSKQNQTGDSEWDQLYNKAKTDDAFLETLVAFEEKKSWEEAVRWMFIKYLTQLEKKGHIVWQSGKTNKDYSTELNDMEIRSTFNVLMDGYNDAWFGHHLVDETTYREYRLKAMNAIELQNIAI